MSRVDPKLHKKLAKQLGVTPRQVDRLINQRANELFVSRPQAALALAAEQGIDVSRFATPDDLQILRQAKSGRTPSVENVTLPAAVSQRTGRRKAKTKANSDRKRRGKSVFVVHGRNERLRKDFFRFLRAIGLNPIEWRKAIQLTGKASPYVAEILDAAFREAVAVVVLLTADDEAKLKRELQKPSDRGYEKKLTGQARPNVLFEAGMAFGRNPEATVLVQIGDVRPFSDIAGRHVAHLSNSPDSRNELVVKLANAGCNVETSGSDWLSEGNFETDV